MHHVLREEGGVSSRRRAGQQRQLGPPPKQVDPNGFGPDDLEEDAPMAERNPGPMFNIAENVTTLDTKTVTLWMAQNWVADDGGIPQL